MRLFLSVILILLCRAALLAEDIPRVFSVSPSVLPHVKARLATNDPLLVPALNQLVVDAKRALNVMPLSVMDKPRAGASGDKHDYVSQAPYFWPDPAKPDGRPYIRRDGERNPESHNEFSDSPRMGRMAGAAETLALAFYFTGDETFARHAATLLRVWFLNPATHMNPNFNQAQAIPGVNTGRGIGMIESRSLTSVCDAVGLLARSTNWTAVDQAGMQKWIGEFLTWAQTSKNGKEEAAAKNNHGSWYDVQLTHMALFVGDTNFARSIVAGAREKRIAAQIKPDGTQPLELARVDSFGYSRFNVQALFALATLGEHVGVDLWRYKAADGASLRVALDYLVDFAEHPEKPWPHERGKKASRTLGSLAHRAFTVYGDERYAALWKKSADWQRQRDVLLFPTR